MSPIGLVLAKLRILAEYRYLARTTTALAWRRIFGSLGEESTLNAFQSMFNDEEFLASRVFQPLHKIVLGFSCVRLEDELSLTTSHIDDTDADGRTALSWAAMRGDFAAVSTSLRFGADTNMPSYWGQRPLHFATQNKRQSLLPILKALIEDGADVNALDYWNRTALIYTSGNHDSIDPLKLLCEHGTALDVRDRRLRTSLGYAARLGNLQHAQYLVALGADPQLPDEFNVLPLLEAVKNNFHDILRLLIPVTDPLQIKPYDSSLLHWVADYSDKTTLAIIQEHPASRLFQGTEVTMVDKDGLIPQELYELRSDDWKPDPEDFNALLQSVSDVKKSEEASDQLE